ncbi:MAG TPA: hypothetical protein VI653_08150, partial [Steroidobacteraceae bacterium]
MPSTNETLALATRARELTDIRRQALHDALHRTLRMILPLQWLGSCLLCWLQSTSGVGVSLCGQGVPVWAGIAVSSLLHGAAFALLRYDTRRTATRYVVGASHVLFYTLFLVISAGHYDTRIYLLVAMGFLAFYRDARLLAAVAASMLAVHFLYGAFVCPPPGQPADGA